MIFLKRRFAICLIIFFSAAINITLAQSSRFRFDKFSSGGDTLLYRQLSPNATLTRKYPLIIFLHGSGERGNDNEAQLKWGVINFADDEEMIMHPAFVIAPQCPANLSWASFTDNKNVEEMRLQPSSSKPMELLMGLIHKLMKNPAIDTNRIYITGLSMGGFGTYDAIERNPNLFAAAVPDCGGGDLLKAPLIAHVPIWIFHGAEDAAVNPAFSIKMADALIKAGAHPGITMYPETGHFSWLAAYRDKQMIEWLFRQHR